MEMAKKLGRCPFRRKPAERPLAHKNLEPQTAGLNHCEVARLCCKFSRNAVKHNSIITALAGFYKYRCIIKNPRSLFESDRGAKKLRGKDKSQGNKFPRT